VLEAARDVFVERGPNAPLDEIAVRAGVGIGTLYRRFAGRQPLMQAVVGDALIRSKQEAEDALAHEADGFAALTRYMQAMLDVRVAAVIPALLDELELDDPALMEVRDASAQAVEHIVDAAHSDGTLPTDVSFGDVGTLLVRLSRPLPGPISAELDRHLAHRHLELLLSGLSTEAQRKKLEGPALSREDLQALRGRDTGGTADDLG
jgi:AcrR family transcriptional regulator